MIRYVDLNSPAPAAPFTTWATASRTIQQAVDVANAGDHIVVTNGVYSDGGRAVEGTLTNRVALNKAVTVRSVNGAAFTTIQGRRADTGTNAPGAVRCAYLTNGASLIGFTLTGGATLSAGLGTLTTGGGAWCASNAVISRCVITGNCAFTAAGGVGGGVLENCVLFGNTAQSAGGALWSTLRNCTVMGNSAGETPGVYVCNVLNSIVLSNTTPSTSAEFLASSFSYSCTAPLASGVGNVSFDPRVQDLAAGDLQLRSDSPCMNRGINAAAAGPIDLAGNPRIFGANVDMGAYEFQGAFVPIAPSIVLQPTNQTVPAGVDALFAVVAQGTPPLSYQWRFEGVDLPLKTEPVLVITNAQAVNVGSYTVRISNQGGPITSSPATLSLRASMTLFVDAAGANPQAPFNTWATAARNLQDAADLAFGGDVILVTNGIYSTGGKFDGIQTNRIVVPRGVKVRSVNGPRATVIRGFYSPNQYASWSRGAYLSGGSSLTGFTIQDSAAGQGGGVYAESPSTSVTNCIIEHNYAGIGGGAYGGTLYNCLLWRNGADHGGGVASATLLNCTVVRNEAGSLPGAVRKLPFTGPTDPGVSQCSANNCIIRLNTVASFEGVGSGSLTNCCISPSFTYGGSGNFTDDPSFVDAANGDFRLGAASPCIDAGNAFSSPGNQDLDGQPRIHGSQIDVGAYEFQGVFAPVPVNITQHPASQQVLLGDSVYLTVSAEGTGPLFYQWQFNGADMPGQTEAHLSLLNVQANQLGSYTVRVTGRTGSPTSNPAIISKVTGSQRYVDSTSPNPLSPYNSWATAARTIQEAVDVAVAGDEIVVTNGVYASGGRIVSGTVTNRIVITNGVMVRSVNGPAFTTIIGATNTRCAYLGSSASLVGFTLTRGTADQGGGAFCLSTNAVIENCIIVSNTASSSGGGALGGTLTNCVLTGNSAYNGGGASSLYGQNTCVLNSCVVSSNTAAYGGGVEGVELNNCLLQGNFAGYGAGAYLTSWTKAFQNCTIVANTATNGGGGVWGTNGVIANSILFYNTAPWGQNWTRGYRPDYINCCTQPNPYEFYEVYAKTIITNEPAFVDLAGGNLRLPSGSPCVNAGTNFFAKGATDLDGNPRIVWGTVDIGAYEYQQGTPSSTLYVDSNSPNPTAPFASWSTAAKSIQDAVDSASAGSVVLVTNGVYSSGGRLFGTLSNRVLVTKPISVRSVNGPRFTFIEGLRDTAPDPNSTSRGSNSVRCVYLAAGASISGFTLTNGATRAPGPVSGNGTETYGGGVYCASPSATVSNCILIGNFANDSGGGVFGGTVFNSLILQNSAYWGAGAAESALVNCTVVRNGYMFAQTARKLPFTGPWGAGIYDCSAINSIIYSNAFFSWNDDNYNGQCAFTNSCTTPMPFEAVDTIDADPLFMDPAAGNFRLRADSPCVNRGLSGSNPGDVDLDGLPRVVGNTIDLGAYEFQGGTAIPFGDWLAGYGLPTDGSADTVDSDNDGANNWQEWLAGSNPTNAASAFKLLTPAVVGNDIVVQWQGQPGMVYSLERGTGLAEPAFQVLATNLVVKPGSNSVAPYYPATYTDTNAAVDPLRLYRVRIGK